MMSLNTPESQDDLPEAHEINVTPFIDVMLVLLIIFMIAAPLATVDMPVDLPASSAASHQPKTDPIYITLRDDLSLAIGEQPIVRDKLLTTLQQQTAGNAEQRLYLRADRQVDYGDLMALLDQLRDGGYRQVALMGMASTATSPR